MPRKSFCDLGRGARFQSLEEMADKNMCFFTPFLSMSKAGKFKSKNKNFNNQAIGFSIKIVGV